MDICLEGHDERRNSRHYAGNRLTRDVIERYSYTPYGEATVLDTNFLPVAGNTSTIGNELLYTGRSG